MKVIQYFKSLLAVFGCITLYSCENLTEVGTPKTQLIGATVYKEESAATAALLDVYARIRENGVISGNLDGLTILMGLYADELTFFGNAASPMDSFYNHAIIPSNESVLSLWANSYSQIYAANAVWEGLSNSTNITGEIRDRLQGEALFIRALLHFHLVNLYGNIPYITTTDYQVNASVSRMPLTEVYERIIIDLKKAKELLPANYLTQERVRVNKIAVQALLARVYTYQEQWLLAELEATDVINNTGLYNLESNLNNVFLKNNSSTIWQLHSGIAGVNTLEGRFLIFTSGPPPLFAINENLMNAFETNDLRKQHWLKRISEGSNIWYHSNKYKENVNTGVSKEYSIIFRLEEQYLIRAEARAHQFNVTGAKQDLNTIRNRAGLDGTFAVTQQEVLLAIYQERRVEFFTEIGHRWFDLKRTGQASLELSPVKPAWHPRDVLMPLPEAEMILNSNLQPQNFGY